MSTSTPPPPSQRMHPAWYGAVMGTGVLALTLDAQAGTWSWTWMSRIADVLLIVASILAVALLPRYLVRLKSRRSLADELGDVSRGPMLATLPAGLLILSVSWGRVGPDFMTNATALWVASALLMIGTPVALALSLAWTSALTRLQPELESVNGGWLIPPLINMLVPLALAPLIAANPSSAPLLVYVGGAFLGIGVVLFLAIFSLLFARLALRPPTPGVLAPSLWIPLAPAGLIGLATYRLLQSAQQAGVDGVTSVTAGLIITAMGIGFGLWWSVFAALEMRRISTAGVTPANPGWWGFVFPVGAMALSLTTLGAATDIAAINIGGLIATAALFVVWARVTWATLRPRRHPHSAPLPTTSD